MSAIARGIGSLDTAAGLRPAWTSRTPAACSTRRIALLTSAMLIMGVLDLCFTLTYMNSIGMYEMNPVARYIITHGTQQHLILFKLATVFTSCTAIIAARRLRKTEPIAWACTLLLLILMLHWLNYTADVNRMGEEFAALLENEDLAGPNWIRLPR